MKQLIFCLLLTLGTSSFSRADIIFQLAPPTQPIVQGNIGTFSLSLVSTILAGEMVDGVDVNVVAGAGNGTNGFFVLPTAHTGILGPAPMDLSVAGQAFASNFLSGGILVPSGLGTTYLNLFLDTTGVALGTYQISLNSLAANSPTLGGLPVSDSVVSYDVVAAIPEPTSFLMVSSMGLVVALRRRRRASAER